MSDFSIYIYRKTGSAHRKVLNEGCGQDPKLLDVQSDKNATKIIIKIKEDTNLGMQIGKEFDDVEVGIRTLNSQAQLGLRKAISQRKTPPLIQTRLAEFTWSATAR